MNGRIGIAKRVHIIEQLTKLQDGNYWAVSRCGEWAGLAFPTQEKMTCWACEKQAGQKRKETGVTKDWTDVKLPWGAHKGKTIEEVPKGYLRWIIDKVDETRYPELVKAADKELSWRDEYGIDE